jgi:hypothetical protein
LPYVLAESGRKAARVGETPGKRPRKSNVFRFEFKSRRLEHLFSKGFQRHQLETLFVETFLGDLFEIFYERDSGVEREALEPVLEAQPDGVGRQSS